MIHVLSLRPPFSGEDPDKIIAAVKQGKYEFPPKYFTFISKEAIDLINACLQMNPELRPSADALVSHPWFSKYIKDSSEPVALEVVDRLIRFKKQSRLAKVCLEVVAHTLPDDKIDGLRQEFAKFDPQAVGEISLNNFRTALELDGSICRSDIDYIFDGIDLSKNKTVQYHKFIAAALSQKQITEREMRSAFDIMSNNTGKITLDLLQGIIGHDQIHLGPTEDILLEEQLSPTQAIEYEDFARIMRAAVL